MNHILKKLKADGFEYFLLDLPDGGCDVSVKKKLSNNTIIGDKETLMGNHIDKWNDILEKLYDRVTKMEQAATTH